MNEVSVLFSEPKIPQFAPDTYKTIVPREFQCSSASRKFLNFQEIDEGWGNARPRFSALQRAENSSIPTTYCNTFDPYQFQCSSASRKFLNYLPTCASNGTGDRVSVLFSEPKIPQFYPWFRCRPCLACFSALQRAENSSIVTGTVNCAQTAHVSVLFSEPKIPQSYCAASSAKKNIPVSVLFSEPKIPQFKTPTGRCQKKKKFQCSSASRKFLNFALQVRETAQSVGFSALQRAENSSIDIVRELFTRTLNVSVLFSEPKIPQFERRNTNCATWNSRFQCSSASRKFLNSRNIKNHNTARNVSVLFSEPKIPQLLPKSTPKFIWLAFQCSSASRKFLNSNSKWARKGTKEFQCSSASRKFLNFFSAMWILRLLFRFSALQRAENSSITVTGKHFRKI